MQHNHTVFTSEQIAELDKELNPKLISVRKGTNNSKLKYIEGHDAMDQADRIFGYGNWSYRTLYCEQCVILDPITREAVGICYKAKVEVEVRGCAGTIIDVGSQPVASCILNKEKTNRWIIMEAHEQAEKGAVTDALKRALRSFGNQFGNGLYGDGRVDLEENREEEKQTAPAASQNAAPQQQQPTQITLTKEQRAAYVEETILLASHMESTDFLAFCKLVGADPESKWSDQEYSASHQKLAQYGAPKSMQDKFSSYTAVLTTPAIQRFAKRVLPGKKLANSCALDVGRSIETLDMAAFLEELAKQYDPEHTKIKAIGATPEYVSKDISVDHVLDCFGHPKEDDLLKEYKGFLREEYLAHPEKLKAFPADLKDRHADSWKRLTAPKKEQKAS